MGCGDLAFESRLHLVLNQDRQPQSTARNKRWLLGSISRFVAVGYFNPYYNPIRCNLLRLINYSLLLILTAQASTGRQGVLGPTKIYLAVQPSSTDSSATAQEASNPPPLAPVVQTVTSQAVTTITQPSAQQVCNMIPKPKVVVQPVNQVLYT